MHVVPRMIFGVSELNLPGDSMDVLVDHVKKLSGGTRPVTTDQVATSMATSVSRFEYGLNYAKRMGFVQEVEGRWIAG
jgi:hypothetical protein